MIRILTLAVIGGVLLGSAMGDADELVAPSLAESKLPRNRFGEPPESMEIRYTFPDGSVTYLRWRVTEVLEPEVRLGRDGNQIPSFRRKITHEKIWEAHVHPKIEPQRLLGEWKLSNPNVAAFFKTLLFKPDGACVYSNGEQNTEEFFLFDAKQSRLTFTPIKGVVPDGNPHQAYVHSLTEDALRLNFVHPPQELTFVRVK